jgi:hypothetical protein
MGANIRMVSPGLLHDGGKLLGRKLHIIYPVGRRRNASCGTDFDEFSTDTELLSNALYTVICPIYHPSQMVHGIGLFLGNIGVVINVTGGDSQ